MRAVVVVALVALFATTAYATSCVEYCAYMNANCNNQTDTTAANSFPYASTAGCLAVCATFPTDGNDGDLTGNTLQCRITHAQLSNQSIEYAQTHCKHASHGGGGFCGTTCGAYCNMMTYSASTPNAAETLGRAPFVDVTACLAYCTHWFTSGAQTIPAVTSGNTAECREYHASVALQQAAGSALASAHFTHALPESSIGQCVRTDATGDTYTSAVENYCDYHLAYCGNTVDNATSVGAYYSSRANCLAQASYLPRGHVSDGYAGNTSNSLDCRFYHVGVAQSIPSHCYHSGINGIDQCGSDSCASYCQQIQNVCTGTNAQFSTYAACYSQCVAYPDAPTISSGLYPTSGNLLTCRFYHLGVAATSAANAALHCIHAGPSGEGYCGSRIEGYCNLMTEACSTTYADAATCLKYAAIYPTTGSYGATSGNNQFCRLYHAGVATTSAAAATTHCPHASYTGGSNTTLNTEVGCGTACENYCNLVINACNSTDTTGTKQWNSRTECEYTCLNAFQKANDASYALDTLACRMYHANVAFAGDLSARTTHCPHAGPSGANTCGSIVEAVCDVAMAACGTTGSNSQFASRAECITSLTGISDGTFGATSGNSLQCRLYHGLVALNGGSTAATTHCPHVSKSNDVCGDSTGAASSMAQASFAMAAVIVGAIATL